MKKWIFTFCSLSLSLVYFATLLYAQTGKSIEDSLTEKIRYYNIIKPASILFAHFDKTIYVNNENVWFTAYLLNYDKRANNPTILSVLLINDHDKTLVAEQKFVMANGVAFGNVVIPDTIPPGDYSFILYTNVLINGKPNDVFKQAITIKATSKPVISASLTLIDTDKAITDGFRKIMFRTTDKDGKPIPAEVTYYLGHKGHSTFMSKVTADNEGQCQFSIPVSQLTPGNNVLYATVKYNKEVKDISLELPTTTHVLNVKFYPEGGNLVHATQIQVGWEVKDIWGKPAKVIGVLFKDKQAIDTIYTDSYGMGRFKLVPLMDSRYKVRLLGSGNDTLYGLPPTLKRGPVLSLKNALANDSLQIRLVSKYAGKYFLMIHNYRKIFFLSPVEVGAVGKTILVNLNDIPKGLNAVTILDSLQRPCTERIFFAHYNKRTLINITTDKKEYTTRQRVHVKMKLDAAEADTLKGIVSVACIQSNRVEIRKNNDIESYVYLKHELEDLPIKERYMGRSADDKAYLENVLLIRGWRRYKWEEMTETQARDTIIDHNTIISFTGAVTRYNKPLKKSTKIMVITDSLTNVISTDPRGEFILTGNKLLVAEAKKVHLLLNNNSMSYAVSIKDPFIPINSQLIKEFDLQDYYISALNTNTQKLNDLEHTINLKGVIIKAVKGDRYGSIYGGTDRVNDCGDYVCRYNWLNCPIHQSEPDNRPAIVGETYHFSSDNFTSHKDIVYTGCVFIPRISAVAINGINYSKEFYGDDFSQVSPSQPEYQSTIYWKHLCFVNSKKEVDMSFYTTDTTGPFKIIIQGVTLKDVVYGEKEFIVRKP